MKQLPYTHIEVDEICRKIIPAQYWNDVMYILYTSILIAHETGADRWGIRLKPESIMLTPGFYEVLQILPTYFHIIVDAPTVPPNMRNSSLLTFRTDRYDGSGKNGYYGSDLNSESCDVHYDMLEEGVTLKKIYEVLLESHRNSIVNSASKPMRKETPDKHSPELVKFVAEQFGQPLPQPLHFKDRAFDILPLPLEEIDEAEQFAEGTVRQVKVNAYDRDARARKLCIEHYGERCCICGMSFGEKYGSDAAGIIHVHHLKPLSDIGEQYIVSPIKDLRPGCPNCHAVIHAVKPARTIDQVKTMLSSAKKP